MNSFLINVRKDCISSFYGLKLIHVLKTLKSVNCFSECVVSTPLTQDHLITYLNAALGTSGNYIIAKQLHQNVLLA